VKDRDIDRLYRLYNHEPSYCLSAYLVDALLDVPELVLLGHAGDGVEDEVLAGGHEAEQQLLLVHQDWRHRYTIISLEEAQTGQVRDRRAVSWL
jgi:hypothetical protein